MTKLTQHQERTFHAVADGLSMIVTVRHDDRCGNGHNTFSITMDAYTAGRPKTDRNLEFCGCCHAEVRKYFPDLAPLIKWHLTSTDGPLHYLANTIYHAENGNLEAARNSAVWPDATLEQLTDANALRARLPALMVEFRAAVESLGLDY